MRKIAHILIAFASFGLAGAIAPCFAKDVSSTSEIVGFYESMELPTPAEDAELQKLAMSQGFDLDSTLKNLAEDDQHAWGEIFKLSMHFSHFDRRAEVYGYQLFTLFAYFIDEAGEAKFSKLINAQPSAIRQRVRDFLYYEAFNSNPDVMKNNERQLRKKLKLIFPADYVFAAKDPLFERFPLK